MMKKTIKYIVALLSFVLLGFTFSSKIEASTTYIYDDANILSSNNEDEIIDHINSLDTDEYYYVIITTYEDGDYYLGNEDSFFKEYVKDKNINTNDNIIGLVINMDCRSYDVFTYGNTYSKFTDYEIQYIIDKMETNMKNGNYTNAVITFINFSDKCYNEDVKSILLLIVPIAIALVIAILVAVVIYVKYKKNAFNESYPLEEFSNINYTNSKDHLINTHVSKVKIETSNSSSSRSSGGGHRGGGRF